MPDSLSLNILVENPRTNSRRKYVLSSVKPKSLISDILREIWEDSNPLSPTIQFGTAAPKADDYGIFLHDTTGRARGRWLNADRTVEEYGLTHESVLEFKPRKRILYIRLQDESQKQIIIDQSLSVQTLLPLICEKMGISNYEEFDLVRVPDETQTDQTDSLVPAKKSGLTALVDPSNYNPATLDTRRMVRLKKKLATEDDVVWVNQEQTLDEQGIEEKDVLLLRRRYFYSDRNVDARDPVQLNLLYVQCKNAVLSGAHPVTEEEAVKFAGLQGQVEYQDFSDSKRSVDIRSFLPRNLNGGKKLDKRLLEGYQNQVQTEWQSHQGLGELDAKDLYIKMAQALKTYGITFFLVKEKMKGRNKLIPRLFGVTRNAVLRLDEKTKETLESRPITTVQKWAVTANTISLDFGDYYEDKFSFQTVEGKQIAQLISGYAELIRKRQRRDSADYGRWNDTLRSTTSSDSQPPLYEELDEAKRTQIGTGNTVVNRQHAESGQVALPGVLRNTYADRQDVHYIGVAQARVAQIIANFAAPFRLPHYAQLAAGVESRVTQEQEYAMEEYHKLFATRMGQVSAAVAQIVNISRSNTPDQTDAGRINQEKIIFELINGLDDLARSLRELAPTASNKEQSTNLMLCGQAFCQSFSDLLSASDPAGKVEGSAEARQGILIAVSRVGDTGRQLAESVRVLRLPTPEITAKGKFAARTEKDFAGYTKQIGSGSTDLVKKAKLLAAEVHDPTVRKLVIHSATELALQSAELIASTKLLRMCSREQPEATAETTTQLLLALGALQHALDNLQGVCRADSVNLEEKARQYVFEMDEGALSLSDVLDDFKRDLSASQDPQKDAVLNALFLLNHQMRELDSAQMSGGTVLEVHKHVQNHRGSVDDPSGLVISKKLRADAENLRICLVSGVGAHLAGRVDEQSLDTVLNLLQTLMQDTVAAQTAGEWQTEEERVAVFSYLKTVYETAYQYISQSQNGATENIYQNDDPLKDAFIEAVDEFTTVLVSMQENKVILSTTLTDLSTSLARVDIDFDEESPPAPVLISRKSISRAATADAISRLEAISGALDEMTSQLKNVNPDVSYHPEALREMASSMCASYRTACANWADFHVSRSDLVDDGSKLHIHRGLVELGHACTELMYAAVSSSNDVTAGAFPVSCKKVLDKISHVQLYLNMLNCGSQTCGRALSVIDEVAEDLETTIIFASAGSSGWETPSTPTTPQLPVIPPPRKSDTNLQDIIAHLQACLRRFTEIETQQDLAVVVEDTLRDTVLMVDSVKCTTSHLAYESADAQMVALRSLRSAAMAVAEAIRAVKTKFSAGNKENEIFSKTAIDVATTTASFRMERLVAVIGAVEEPLTCRGERLLWVSANGLISEMENSMTYKEQPDSTNIDGRFDVSIVEELRVAVNKMEVALQSRQQVDFLEAANLLSEISTRSKLPRRTPDVEESREGSESIVALNIYLKHLVQILGTTTTTSYSSWDHPEMVAARRGFHETMAKFEARRAARLKEQKPFGDEFSDLASPDTGVSQNIVLDGLSEAAARIDKAARKLDQAQARRTIYIPTEVPLATFDETQDFHDPLYEFDENVLDACKAIMAVSAALIPVAGRAQEELVKFGRVSASSGYYTREGEWSHGFISSARAIGGACQTLCDAAHALVMGHATEEKLISAAKQVASYTAQLLLASRVRGDMNSPTMKRLLAAGNQVRRATDQLVQVFIRRRRDESPDLEGDSPGTLPNVVVNKKLVGGIAQEIKANEQVLKKERELVEAQKQLLLCRKAKYAGRHAGASPGPKSPTMFSPATDDLTAQEMVLIKERELKEARSHLLALRQQKYGTNTADDEYSGYGAATVGSLVGKTAN